MTPLTTSFTPTEFKSGNDPARRFDHRCTHWHRPRRWVPVLVVNGTDDTIIATINSYILQQFLPNAELIIYPDANHGAHFQYPDRFVTHTKTKPFLDR
ncbi:alpha/beta fold hydrolase [Streptacidiphilus sp. MAP12-16]|uniref:alpha/beta fold hydrolase n=1 Tax=Streptacidiphilus sp. MAP12-16 TaxID=3156300 RepID=UPI00351861E9